MQATTAGRGKGAMPLRRWLLVGAVICAGIAVLATWWVARRPSVPSAPSAGETVMVKKVPIVVAAKDLTKGTRISTAEVKIVEVPEDKAPKDAFNSVEAVRNALLVQDVPKETPLRTFQVMPSPEQLREFSVPIGLRGFVLYQPFTEGAADILLPGDLVDVIATRREGDVTVAEVVVRRAQVLVAENYVPGMSRGEMVRQRILSRAAQATPAPPEPKPAAQPGQPTAGEGTATTPSMRRIVLAVTPQEAVRLARAMEEGRALTVLRNEHDYFPTPPFRSPLEEPKEKTTPPPPPRPPERVTPAVPPTPVAPVRTVVVYRGTEREEVIVSH
ncbi:MAG: hypothetical protein IMHGJWDQ_000157 [Candidatus Fervidibacter sp.]